MAIQDYNSVQQGNLSLFKQSSNVSKNKVYSDLNLEFLQHPDRLDIIPLKDIDAVKQSVKNLVLTNFYERPFHPEIGGNVSSKLFEQADAITGIAIKREILQVLKDWEPRVNGVKVEVFDNIDANELIVNIIYNVIFLQMTSEVTFNLQRLR
jgi:phage baseplate assembly protein W